MFYFDRLNGDRWLSCFVKSMCIEKLQEHDAFCFDRSFPWCGRRLFSAEAAGEVGPVSGLDGLPSEGSWRAESWSGHSLCRVKEGKTRKKKRKHTWLYVVFFTLLGYEWKKNAFIWNRKPISCIATDSQPGTFQYIAFNSLSKPLYCPCTVWVWVMMQYRSMAAAAAAAAGGGFNWGWSSAGEPDAESSVASLLF